MVFNRLAGIKEDIYEEGMHFMVPWFERPIMYDVRAKLVTIQSVSGPFFANADAHSPGQ